MYTENKDIHFFKSYLNIFVTICDFNNKFYHSSISEILRSRHISRIWMLTKVSIRMPEMLEEL